MQSADCIPSSIVPESVLLKWVNAWWPCLLEGDQRSLETTVAEFVGGLMGPSVVEDELTKWNHKITERQGWN